MRFPSQSTRNSLSFVLADKPRDFACSPCSSIFIGELAGIEIGDLSLNAR